MGLGPDELDDALAFRLFVESVKDYAIFILDTGGRVATWNPGAERIKGYRRTEIVGQHFSIFYPPEDVAAGKTEMELEGAERDGRFEDEGWRVRKDGTRFWANVIITALRAPDGKLIGFGKVTRDLTQRVKMEQERLQLAASQEADKRKDEFLAIMGHELRNPLAPMVTALHIIKLRGTTGLEKEVAVLDRQLRHMKRLVDDLLDVSGLLSGKLKLAKKQVEVADIVARGIEVSMPLIESKKQSVRLVVQKSGLPVDVDPERMVQVFGNLLNNASKYADEGGHLTIRASGEGDRVTVRFEDDGSGIPAELIPRLFDLFSQGKQGIDRRLGGLGIGLAVARRLVDSHGGEISVESEGAGRGSCFIVRLPRADHLSANTPFATPLPPARSLKKVLIVEDNKDSADMMRVALELRGHVVEVGHDAAEAMATATRMKPHVVFLDLSLPDVDGYETQRRLRAIPGLADIPIIAVSGHARGSDRQKSLDSGFTEHLSKPVDMDRIHAIVEGIK